jgi:hypothetical protein
VNAPQPARAVVLAAVRTPVGRYGGGLAGVRPDDLAAIAVRAAVDRAGVDPATIDDVYLLLPYTRGSAGGSRFQAPLGLFLQAAPAREVLARMLRNLKEIHRSAENWPCLLAVTQRLVVLLPGAWAERRDRGLAYAALGCDDAAAADLAAYLERAGAITDRDAVAARLTLLARGRSPRLH